MANGEIKENTETKDFDIIKTLRGNLWIVSTIVLAIVLAGVLILRGGSATGDVISADKAAENLMSFVKSQGAESATVVSKERDGNLYKVVVKYNGEDIPVYVTLDGKYLASGLIPLTAGNTAGAKDNSNNAEETPKEVPKSDKPKVELFVMSLCPYGLQMEKGILPVAVLLKNKIDFKVKFVYYAMHDKPEIDENTRQYCIQKEQGDKFLNYLSCYVKEGKTDECLKEAKIDNAKLTSCINNTDKQFNISANYNDKSSWLSGRFPRYNVDLADNEKYGVGGSPTLVINGQEVQSGRDSASLLKTICSAFNNAPEECKQTLSSNNPSPGFGYSTSGSATTASCG